MSRTFAVPAPIRRWPQSPTATPIDAFAFVGWLAIWSTHVWAVLGEHSLSAYADDFFYYAIPAEELLRSGVPSFDGVVATNGFQPLWFLTITAALGLTGGEIDRGFSIALQLITTALLATSYLAAWDLSRRILGRAARATACALFWSVGCCWMSRDGMEAPLVLCFATLLLRRLWIRPLFDQTPRALLATGLLASLTILARLDSVLLVALLFVFQLPDERTRQQWKTIVPCIAVGGMLLPLYLASNWQLYDTLLPVSGAAKQLKTSGWPSLDPTRLYRLAQVAPLYSLGWLVCAPVATLVALRRRGESSRIVLAAATFPLLFLAVHWVMSDWIFWDWYLYPVLVSLAVVLPDCLARLPGLVRGRVMTVVWMAIVLFPLYSFIVVDGWRAHYPFITDARQLQPFLDSHEGVYAMGDRAGAVRLLTDRRVVQTEGLVMDRAFLDDIAAERALVPALRDRGVRYYIVNRPADFTPPPGPRGCPIFEEPSAMVRGSSAAMSGPVCAPPVRVVTTSSERTIRIFDLDREPDG